MKLHAELVWDVFMHIGSACMERSIFSFHCFTLAVPFLSKILGGWTKVVPLCFWKVGDVGNWEEGGEESVSIPAGEGSGL